MTFPALLAGDEGEGPNYRLLCPRPLWLVLKKKGGKKGGQRQGWEGGGKKMRWAGVGR